MRASATGKRETGSDGQETLVVSAVLGLLALLMGFTFALAVDRFETRRELVVEEANAIGATYLRAQLLDEPHRDRVSAILVRYVDNRIALAKAPPGRASELLTTNDQLLTDLWAATSAAFEDIKALPFSNALLETTNRMIDLDSTRKAARLAHVPGEVFVVLIVYLIVACGVLGFVLTGIRGRVTAAVLLVLQTMSMMLIVDIDRPTLGGILESQAPMEALRDSMTSQPPLVFDRWRRPQPPSS
jgi:hypothetical protein